MKVIKTNQMKFMGFDCHGNKKYLSIWICEKIGFKGTLQDIQNKVK